jgi:hypothetical protein
MEIGPAYADPISMNPFRWSRSALTADRYLWIWMFPLVSLPPRMKPLEVWILNVS